MRSDAILVKTPAGREALLERAQAMPWRERALLVAIHGELTVFELRQRLRDRGDIDALIDDLLQRELISCLAHQFAQIEDEAVFDAESLARALLQDGAATMSRLGRFVFGLALRAAKTRQQLRALLPEYQRLLAETTSEELAARNAQRIGMLLGDATRGGEAADASAAA